jgi:hypothetical protein
MSLILLLIVKKHVCGLEFIMVEYCLQFLHFHVDPFLGCLNTDLIYSVETCNNKQRNSFYFQHFSACMVWWSTNILKVNTEWCIILKLAFKFLRLSFSFYRNFNFLFFIITFQVVWKQTGEIVKMLCTRLLKNWKLLFISSTTYWWIIQIKAIILGDQSTT